MVEKCWMRSGVRIILLVIRLRRGIMGKLGFIP